MKQKNMPKHLSRSEKIAEKRLLTAQYGTKEKRFRTRLLHHLRFVRPSYWWKERPWWQRILVILVSLVVLFIATSYGVARWYIAKHANEPVKFGTTFIANYARFYGLDPHETLNALVHDLNFRHFRLVSYWSEIEKTPGKYDFSELDWQFDKVEEVNGTVSLAIGLRQPRWPECHMPDWAKSQPKSVWYPQLKTFMGKVIERYKDRPGLDSYQLENEFFLSVFGICPDFSRDRLVDEFNFVKSLDPDHPIIVSRSNNAWGIPIGQPRPDKSAVSVYKRVWDRTITKRYFEYPFPAWFYASLAGWGEIFTGRQLIIHELQAEPWGPDKGIPEISIAEQNKSLDADRLRDRFEYGRATGMREVDLWGSEMWYWRKVKFDDPSLWNAARDSLRKVQCTSCYK